MSNDFRKPSFDAGGAGLVLLFTLLGAGLGYGLASGLTQFWLRLPESDTLFLLKNARAIWHQEPRLANFCLILIVGSALMAAGFAIKLFNEPLTAFGTTHWQSKRELEKGNFFGDPKICFPLAKTSTPKRKGRLIASRRHPHVLMAAPTGAGKGVGFVIPTLLSYLGSAVVLDVKGENFEKTARRRMDMGQKVYRFSPADFDNSTWRYNPLDRIARFENPAKRQAELDKLAAMFLQADDSTSQSFLPNSREVFTGCAMLAYERGSFNMGTVYQLAFGGGTEPQKRFAAYAEEVKNPSAALIFDKLAGTTERTLSAYLSILSSAGMFPWSNPHTCAATAVSDFDLSTFRGIPQTLYFTTPTDDIPPMAPLVRLLYSDLIAQLQHHEPGPDEPFPVLMMLDEFQRLGKMPAIVDSISLLRSFGGQVAIVTQSIPDLDRVYGAEARKVLQAGSGIKVYLTPTEDDTVNELSGAVGMTTRRVVSRSRQHGKVEDVFHSNVSARSEEKPLLSPDQARRLPADDVVIVVNAEMPIRAKRIKYYEDHFYGPIFRSQDMTKPLPAPPHMITAADYVLYQKAPNILRQKASEAAANVADATKKAQEAGEAAKQKQQAADQLAARIAEADKRREKKKAARKAARSQGLVDPEKIRLAGEAAARAANTAAETKVAALAAFKNRKPIAASIRIKRPPQEKTSILDGSVLAKATNGIEALQSQLALALGAAPADAEA